jgi:hypothetical protein
VSKLTAYGVGLDRVIVVSTGWCVRACVVVLYVVVYLEIKQVLFMSTD